MRRAASASLILILMEALLGAGLVLFGYTGTDASTGRAVYLSAHLVNTLLMIGAMALTALWGSREDSSARRFEWNTPAVLAILAALLIAVTGTIAALSETLFPSASLRAGWTADFAAASPLFVRLRIWHPVIALMAGSYIGAFALMAAYKSSGAKRLGTAVAGLVGLQIVCGSGESVAARAGVDADGPSAGRRSAVDRAGAPLGRDARTQHRAAAGGSREFAAA